eukprot:gb/GFBE01059693.1/.p1 GENE.gb/GFBE01059693.1/~~gb/GFBE01059693.1/.p1  ORF type:complete len:380 (+),score=38.34 gb/GFBE01059693.1/:1-1140(+)
MEFSLCVKGFGTQTLFELRFERLMSQIDVLSHISSILEIWGVDATDSEQVQVPEQCSRYAKAVQALQRRAHRAHKIREALPPLEGQDPRLSRPSQEELLAGSVQDLDLQLEEDCMLPGDPELQASASHSTLATSTQQASRPWSSTRPSRDLEPARSSSMPVPAPDRTQVRFSLPGSPTGSPGIMPRVGRFFGQTSGSTSAPPTAFRGTNSGLISTAQLQQIPRSRSFPDDESASSRSSSIDTRAESGAGMTEDAMEIEDDAESQECQNIATSTILQRPSQMPRMGSCPLPRPVQTSEVVCEPVELSKCSKGLDSWPMQMPRCGSCPLSGVDGPAFPSAPSGKPSRAVPRHLQLRRLSSLREPACSDRPPVVTSTNSASR